MGMLMCLTPNTFASNHDSPVSDNKLTLDKCHPDKLIIDPKTRKGVSLEDKQASQKWFAITYNKGQNLLSTPSLWSNSCVFK